MVEETKHDKSVRSLQDRMRSTLAKNIMLARRAKYLSQGELAEKSGVSRVMLAQIETAKADPSMSLVVGLADALNISPFLLLLSDSDQILLVEMSEELTINA